MSTNLGPRIGENYLDCLRHALTFVDGYALEFGVASGRTLKMLAEKLPVTGFDSFEGLPENWRSGFPKGAFACAPPSIPGAEVVVGWFEDTLPKWIADNHEKVVRLGLVHVDCDLYSSTSTVLHNLFPYMSSGVVLVFDEYHGYPGWEGHEHRAWVEFTERNNISFEVLGHGPEQLIVRVL